MTNKFRQEFATRAAEAFRRVFPDKFTQAGMTQVFSDNFVYEHLEKPKDAAMGRFALPVFRFAGFLGRKPNDIASEIAAAVQSEVDGDTGNTLLANVTAAGGFINVQTQFGIESADTITGILEQDANYGSSDDGSGRRILVEYSSPNIAKPFGVGHLRTTILGNSLRRIFRKLGFEAIGINYLGDWGTQFGKMIVAFRKWGGDKPNGEKKVEDLLDLYVRFHREADGDDELNVQARQAFKNLEDGVAEETELWERFRAISMAEFSRVYGLMGIEFDWITGEAFLNDKMDAVIDRLDRASLTSVSEGALVVDLNDPQLPPCLLRKADGATLYATRDITGLLYRWGEYRFEEALYVVSSAQSDHFKQVFKVVELLEEAENIPAKDRVSGRAKHVDFGWVKFGDKAMSTRQGNIVLLQDVVDQAVELARQRIIEKNPDLKEIDQTATMIGVGAVIFSQLSVRRQKDVNFDWDEVLSFEGETGPYLQYTHARLCSLLRNYDGQVSSRIDLTQLDREEERRVVELLADFPEAIRDAARNYEPNHISTHLLKLAGAFNKVYQRKDSQGKIDKIISDDKDLTAARMALVKGVQVVISQGLYLLGIQALEEM